MPDIHVSKRHGFYYEDDCPVASQNSIHCTRPVSGKPRPSVRELFPARAQAPPFSSAALACSVWCAWRVCSVCSGCIAHSTASAGEHGRTDCSSGGASQFALAAGGVCRGWKRARRLSDVEHRQEGRRGHVGKACAQAISLAPDRMGETPWYYQRGCGCYSAATDSAVAVSACGRCFGRDSQTVFLGIHQRTHSTLRSDGVARHHVWTACIAIVVALSCRMGRPYFVGLSWITGCGNFVWDLEVPARPANRESISLQLLVPGPQLFFPALSFDGCIQKPGTNNEQRITTFRFPTEAKMPPW